MGTGSFPGG